MTPHDLLESLKDSGIERATVRPYWPGDDSIWNAGIWWTKQPLDAQGRFTLQRHRRLKKVVRLVDERRSALIGWGVDEDFLREELWPLYSRPSGHVRLQYPDGNEIRFAHISDLHLGWRRAQTLEGPELALGVLEQLAASMAERRIEFVLATGDITDNGLGYMRFAKAFGQWISTGRLLVVPGNHDLTSLGLTKMSSAHKGEDYEQFSRIAMGPSRNRNFVVDAGGLVVLGLDSSGKDDNALVLDNAIGRVDEQVLEDMSQALRAIRVAGRRPFTMLVMHHHLEIPPQSAVEYGAINASDLLLLQLSNAAMVARFCADHGVNVVLHGHKHVSYAIPAETVPSATILSAPSTTLSRRYHIVTAAGNQVRREEVRY